MLLRVELRRIAPLYVTALLAVLVPRLLSAALPDVVAASVVYGLAAMLAWCAVTAYLAHRLFAYYCLGHDLFLHITVLGRRSVLLVKAGALALATVGLGVVSVACDASAYGGPGAADLGYLLLARTVSVLSFLALALLGTAVVRRAGGRTVMAVGYVAFLVAVAGAVGTACWALAAPEGAGFFVGVSDAYGAAPAYATVVPFFALGGEGFVTALSAWSTVADAAVGALAMAAWWLLAGRQRANFQRV